MTKKERVRAAVDEILKEFDQGREAFFDDEVRNNRHVRPLTKIMERYIT